ncbi:hypothetical protein Esti_003908 [Eimeria stiedai]
MWGASCRLHAQQAPNPLRLAAARRAFAACTSSCSSLDFSSYPSHAAACRSHPSEQPSAIGTVQSGSSQPSPRPQGTSGLPTLAQLDSAFQVYRRVMRVHRRVLQKPTARRLADAFVKNEFRLHMAAASAELRRGFSEEEEDVRCRDTVGKGKQKRGSSFSHPSDAPKCTEAQFHQFLKAWENYLELAAGEATALRLAAQSPERDSAGRHKREDPHSFAIFDERIPPHWRVFCSSSILVSFSIRRVEKNLFYYYFTLEKAGSDSRKITVG